MKPTNNVDKGLSDPVLYKTLFNKGAKFYRLVGRGFWFFGLDGEDTVLIKQFQKKSATKIILENISYVPFASEHLPVNGIPEEFADLRKDLIDAFFKDCRNYNPRRNNLLLVTVSGFGKIQEDVLVQIVFDRFGIVKQV